MEVGSGPTYHSVEFAFINDDAYPDLLVASGDAADRGVHWYENSGGSFGIKHVIIQDDVVSAVAVC